MLSRFSKIVLCLGSFIYDYFFILWTYGTILYMFAEPFVSNLFYSVFIYGFLPMYAFNVIAHRKSVILQSHTTVLKVISVIGRMFGGLCSLVSLASLIFIFYTEGLQFFLDGIFCYEFVVAFLIIATYVLLSWRLIKCSVQSKK